MKNLDELSDSVLYDKVLKRAESNRFRASTASTTNSIIVQSSTNSPRNLQGSENFSQSLYLEIISEEEDPDNEKPTKKIKNFHKVYLNQGLWPDIPTHTQSDFKSKYKKLKSKYYTQKLSNNFKNSVQKCTECIEVKKKNENIRLTLEEAIELSTVLLKEMKNKIIQYN
jgi:hypothetical protein